MDKKEKLNKIIEIIENKGITAYSIAQKTSLTEAGIGKIISGKSTNPREKSLDEILNYLENNQNSLANEPVRNQEAIENKNGNSYYPHPNGGFVISAPLVPFNAYASFVETYDDEKGLIQFENSSFKVDHVGRGRYVAFTVIGDSMWNEGGYDTPHGAEVLARELQRHHWKDGFGKTDYGWIIICESSIMHKDIISDIDENGCIKLHSRNPSPQYPDFDLDINTVHSIWKVIKRTF